MSFFQDYFDLTGGTEEAAVLCPFPHKTAGGVEYYESNPSAFVNVYKKVFHCMACDTGLSEAAFIKKLFGCSFIDAKKIATAFLTSEYKIEWINTVRLTEESKQRALSLGISQEVIEELNLGTPTGEIDTIAFPVFLYGHLIDVGIYDPTKKPKLRNRKNSPAGLIVPFDNWINSNSNKMTIICAGQKDMAIARSKGFNAITFTGGENTTPKMLGFFKNKSVAICYDNDVAGKSGALKLAKALYKYTDKIRIVTNFHAICKEKGEDLADFFIKYNQPREALVAFIKDTPLYIPSPEDDVNNVPIMDLYTASKAENVGKVVSSNIQIVAVSDATFLAPSTLYAEKYRLTGENDTMALNEIKDLELTNDNAENILHLVDNNFKETEVEKNIRTLLKIPVKERCVKIKHIGKKTVFKCYITDMFETNDTQAQPLEFTAYSIDCKLESGKKYLVTYKLVPHPYKGQQLTMIILNAVQANDSVSNFQITPEVRSSLDIIRDIPGNVEDKINTLTEKVKGLIGFNGNNTLIKAIDLAYHTVLQFNFGTFQLVRGYLDVLVVGESRVGKSSTADALRRTYGLGTFTSLAGNSATVPGLIGGSNKTSGGSYQTRAGIIPQNHRGLIIFEEFGKSNANIVKELTDIRSSNEVRITRVAGTITMPALVRMIALTNVKNTTGIIKPIASYPNGISIVTELVDTAEDIARYDLIVVLSDRGANVIDPFWEAQAPLPEQVYRDRIRWVWSRSPEQIIISKEVGLYILEQANRLNSVYECHIKIFGTEAWKKISRLAIAIAGYTVSTDASYETIIVTEEHVDYAVIMFIEIYDNPTFKLREYVEHERKFSTIDDAGVSALQDIYTKYPGLIQQLEQCASATKNMLGAGSGLKNDDLNVALNRLSQGLFIKFQTYDIVPTERFRLGLAKINRGSIINRVGE